MNCSRIKPIDRFNDKESSLFARESIKSINKQISSSLLKIESYFIRLSSSNRQASSFVQLSFQKKNLIMPSRSSTEEHFEEFRNRFFQISDADSLKSRTKSSSAASFIHEDDESFAETIIFLVFYEIWKARSLVLDEETDQLYKLNK